MANGGRKERGRARNMGGMAGNRGRWVRVRVKCANCNWPGVVRSSKDRGGQMVRRMLEGTGHK